MPMHAIWFRHRKHLNTQETPPPEGHMVAKRGHCLRAGSPVEGLNWGLGSPLGNPPQRWPSSPRTIMPSWRRPGPKKGPKGPKRGFGQKGPKRAPKTAILGKARGVRTRWGQKQAKSTLTVVYRGGPGAPPEAHWVRSSEGPQERGTLGKPGLLSSLSCGRSHHVSPRCFLVFRV